MGINWEFWCINYPSKDCTSDYVLFIYLLILLIFMYCVCLCSIFCPLYDKCKSYRRKTTTDDINLPQIVVTDSSIDESMIPSLSETQRSSNDSLLSSSSFNTYNTCDSE